MRNPSFKENIFPFKPVSYSNNKKDIFVFLFENVLNSDNFIYYFCCVELLKSRTTYLWISH